MVRRILARALLLALTLTAIGVVFYVLVRPWYRDWGSTAEERTRVLPGDEIVADAAGQNTRAITIRAPIADVWPWVAQTGQDRGGFYSFDLLENLVGCDMPTVDVLRSEKQIWQVGDKLWMYPSDRGGGIGFATLRSYVPGRALGFGTRMLGASLEEPEVASWTFVLEPIDSRTTRLLIRGRGRAEASLLAYAFGSAVFEPIHFVMERRMMIGLKQLAEEGTRHRALNNVHIALWVITALMGLFAAYAVFTRPDWKTSALVLAAVALVFQVLTFGQPPLMVGMLLVMGTAAIVFRARPTANSPHEVRHDHSAAA